MKNEKIINNKVKTEFSAGCVVFKKLKAQGSRPKAVLFALGKHSGYHKWVLPKGLIEEGEDKVSTAVRETAEELGIKVKIVNPRPVFVAKYVYFADLKERPKISNFQFPISKQFSNFKLPISKQKASRRVQKYQEQGGNKTKVFKTVYFYLAEYVSGNIAKHGWEMSEAGWFDYQKALELLSFKDEKEAVKKALTLLK